MVIDNTMNVSLNASSRLHLAARNLPHLPGKSAFSVAITAALLAAIVLPVDQTRVHGAVPVNTTNVAATSFITLDDDKNKAPGAAADLEIDRRWLERLRDEDRFALEVNIGYAAPDIPESVRWPGRDDQRATWDDFRGKVVLIQSWTSGTGVGRNALMRSARLREQLAEQFGDDDLVFIALHTPENADNADQFLERHEESQRQSLPVTVAIDPVGTFCDELGIYQRPANVLIDRQGAVRAAGLNEAGVRAAIAELAKRPFDPDVKPEPFPETDEDDEESKVEFPPPNRDRFPARNLQGYRAPDFYVERWITDQPDPASRVVVLAFWQLGQPEAAELVGYLNRLANTFRRDVVIVAVTDETRRQFDEELLRKRMRVNQFSFAVALDQSARMAGQFDLRGIPHIAVMTSIDWTVRWQGSPADLTPDLLRRFVESNRQLVRELTERRTQQRRRVYRWTDG